MNRLLTYGWLLLALPAGANATLTIVAEPRPVVARRAGPVAEPAERRPAPAAAPTAERTAAPPAASADKPRCFEGLLSFSLGDSDKIGGARGQRCD